MIAAPAKDPRPAGNRHPPPMACTSREDDSGQRAQAANLADAVRVFKVPEIT